MTHQTHTYHIVNPSPWPLTGALSALLITSGLIMWFHLNSIILLILGLLTNTLTIYQCWRDVIRESTFQGHHTPIVQKGLGYGIILFIISKVLFFFTGFFWAFCHSSLTPTPELGGCWALTGIHPLNPLEVLLLNTSVLLASGCLSPGPTTASWKEIASTYSKPSLWQLPWAYILHSYKPWSIVKLHLQSQMEYMDQLSLWPQGSMDCT